MKVRTDKMIHGSKKPKTKIILTFVIIVLIIVSALIIYGTHRKLPRDANSIPRVKFSFSGVEQSHLKNPLAVAIASNGWVYVSDSGNNQVKVFDSQGEFKFAFGQAGRGNGQFNTPYGIGILPDGSVLVSDMLNNRIQQFDKRGKFIGMFLTQSNQIKPGMLLIQQKEIYVSDLAAHRIVVMNQEGRILRNYNGDLNFPQGIANQNDKLLVADSGNHLLKIYSPGEANNGQVFGPRNQFNVLRGLAVDNLNRVLVVDSLESNITFLSPKGDFLFTIGSPGNGQNQFMYPAGVALDRFGNIYVADWGNNRIQVWGY